MGREGRGGLGEGEGKGEGGGEGREVSVRGGKGIKGMGMAR